MSDSRANALVSEIYDLTRRLNDATWAAAHLSNITVTYESTTPEDGREVLHPIFTKHPAKEAPTPVNSTSSPAREAHR